MIASTIHATIHRHGGSGVALAAPGRPPLTYADLQRLCHDVAEALATGGIAAGQRVAIVLPNGPEMAAAFLTIACCASTAPLNPAYTAEEFAFYLDDLRAAALVVEHGSSSPAIAVAADRCIPVLELRPGTAAGAFTLSGATVAPARRGPTIEPTGEREALVLHTSGTTSRPKIVPLSHGNVSASARHIGKTLALGPSDRCLNVMPLFHIHGLIAATLSTIAAGGSVFCAPGFNALKFFAWLDEAEPTWYTAVPTMHQAILTRADRNRDIIRRRGLRFIRSSSASLAPQVMAELERTFGAPVIESYGMTEAAHQMASNPLPPAERKPGTVGIAAGPEIAVMDERGAMMPPGMVGEVVIRGPNVTAGYENNSAANTTAFTAGWFRTGDQGVLDRDGYLTITGRLKEIINRGGEKISPREVDEVLLDHPAVAQAITFAMPHASLGEEVAAAVVLRDGATLSEQELRSFAGRRLAPFKVPRRVVILDEIPKGATGKLQRIGLASKLGLTGERSSS
ncbi:MAG: AMP-dependent synthetase [Alphaproteobacteria bacterium]|nr:AMP-dependent synthetase [Alphaproteobacteria bacterium]